MQAPSDKEEEEEEVKKETWHSIPHPIPTLGSDCRAVWVGGRGNLTFIADFRSESWTLPNVC